MAKNEDAKAEVVDPSVQKAQKGGTPVRGRIHDGPAGAGEMRDLGARKWNKEGRDPVSEKEPGKSRGPGGI